ncbi:Rpn family recombination-promoting nuclease/putative transposase [Clostridium sp. YIM B02505]|uniref:Rpn family recombination-promoting nuclease/putative transposase n=1 Tax=Clostridium yunnanense TaxID=2800325 RepID=A0ABS1ES74_9CLOT|nr:Rpn family recombination-promoting nuclease/putative transposase [Clostridium yunnanense]MBK1812251.1 Rpn family recombination-promoting nuclease/putative transposase [Clostridium yunnanense]
MRKDLNNIHDKIYKDLYSNKEVFIDLVKEMLKAPWAKDLTPDKLKLVNKSYISSDYDEKESDIVYEGTIGDKKVIFYVLLEFQSSLDYRMPLRLFFYISEILREYAKNENHKASDKSVKIPAVIPIVLYNGKKPWDVTQRFRDIIDGSELFEDNIIDFKYSVFDVNNKFTKEQLIEYNNITSAIFLLDQKIDAKEFIERIKAIALFFSNLTDKERMVLKHWIENTIEKDLANTAKEILDANKEEVERMVANNAFLLKELKEEAKKQGKLEGKLEGKNEAKIEIAKNLLDVLDDATISAKTGLSLEVIKALRKA